MTAKVIKMKGYSYVRLATEILQAASYIKPFKLYENIFTKEPSDFSIQL